MYGDSRENLLEILAVVIISSAIFSVRGKRDVCVDTTRGHMRTKAHILNNVGVCVCV